jgi:hypothetical protein
MVQNQLPETVFYNCYISRKFHFHLKHHGGGSFHSIQESLEVVVAMKHHLYTCEMIDDTILDLKNIGTK